MTVASLWKVLDNAGCGVAVGAQDLMNANRSKQDLTNPWNYNETNHKALAKKRPALAIDLSIWVCEGLTSPGMAQNHINPALHLAYTRSMKLLGLGIKLVIVVEGKRRVLRTEEPDKFHKRRSGTAFWKACKACEEMFEAMGVPVVKAKAEGEALCALLSQRGIVDGVISNDGDCLLFGAKVVYTKFSIENLQNSQVFRYDSSELKAVVESESDEKRDEIDNGKISLSRHDLISFALLTGSDLAGNGLPKVGHKKAARFLFKCKHDHPLSNDTAAIEELRSWARTAKIVHAYMCEKGDGKEKERCCSICNHPGDKRSHLKDGCETCGTEPGEGCYQFTGSDRFRRGLREKALALQPKFAPTIVVNAYLKPNDNQIPLLLEGATSKTLTMGMPSLSAFLATGLIVKGRSFAASREFVMGTLSRLMVRRDLFGDKEPRRAKKRRTLSKEMPVAQKITRKLVKDKTQCFEVTWNVQATVTDSNGVDIDGYEFSTIEPQELIGKQYPDLVTSFGEVCIELQKQGDTEREKRKEFIETLLSMPCGDDHQPGDDEDKKPRRRGGKKKRVHDSFFESKVPTRQAAKRPRIIAGATDEIKAMMGDVGGPKKHRSVEFDSSTIATGSIVFHIGESVKKKRQYGKTKPLLFKVQPLGMTITVFKPSSLLVHNIREERSKDYDASVEILKQPSRQTDLGKSQRIHESKRYSEASVAVVPQLEISEEGEGNRTKTKFGIQNFASNDVFKKSTTMFRRAEPTTIEAKIVKSPVSFDHHAVVDLSRTFPEQRKKTERANFLYDKYPNAMDLHRSINPVEPRPIRCEQPASDQQQNLRATLAGAHRDGAILSEVLLSRDIPAELIEGVQLDQKNSITPARAEYVSRPDPDAWMAQVVAQDGTPRRSCSIMGSRVKRQLEYATVESTKMPSLPTGRDLLIVCDMGIPIPVTPLVATKRN